MYDEASLKVKITVAISTLLGEKVSVIDELMKLFNFMYFSTQENATHKERGRCIEIVDSDDDTPIILRKIRYPE